jgi:polysaccharide deacetylase family protein (PEP-CTERM system associated)
MGCGGEMAEKENVNILQIDVEDWYADLDIREWELYEDRVVQSTDKVLEILRKRKIQATFFVLGYVAECFPELVERIKDGNHEIGSHGYSHTRITQQTPLEFEKDLAKSIEILERLTGDKVLGYRAPEFTLVEETSWVIDILKKYGLEYDSSIFPTRVFPIGTHLYGIPDAPRFPYCISSSDVKRHDLKGDFLEIPLSVYRIPGTKMALPVAGGFYLRFFPYMFISHALKEINAAGQPAVCYLHPWELDPEHPQLDSIKWYHYYRLDLMEDRLSSLLGDFKFTSTRKWIDERGKQQESERAL